MGEWNGTVSKPLPWEGTCNARDLGGYPTQAGGMTKKGVFYRTDGLQSLTEAGKKALLDSGVACVVDLRTEMELRQAPDRVSQADGVAWYHVPLADGVASNGFQELPARMGEMYVGLLEHSGDKLAQVFRAFAAHPEGAALFHCSAGKDRTGVTAMLLLALAGVPKQVILADYAASYGNLAPLFAAQKAKMKEMGIVIPEHVMRSDPEELELAMDWMEQNHGTAERYLLHTGLEPSLLEEIKSRLTQR